MIPETSTVIEYLPGSPCVTERFTLMTQDAGQALRRMLSRFGLPPLNVGFRIGGVANQEIYLVMRRSDGGQVDIGRIMYGLALADLEAARNELIAADWQPRPPKYETRLPDGKDI